MKPAHTSRFNWRFIFTGRFAQLNITLLVLVPAFVFLLIRCVALSDPVLRYTGSAASFLVLFILVILACVIHGKQHARPEASESSLEIHNKAGQALVVRNPPDRLLAPEQINACARSLLVGFDPDLCPDGKVVGKASEGKIERYSEEEKEDFRRAHSQQVSTKKNQIRTLLDEGETAKGTPTSESNATSG